MWKRISGVERAFTSAAPLFLPIRYISGQLARPLSSLASGELRRVDRDYFCSPPN